MAHYVICRICKKKFDTEKEEAVIVGQKSYYHKSCYESWKGGKDNVKTNNNDDNFWYEALIDYLYRDVKLGEINFQKIQSQWINFTKPEKGYTPKGIYFAIRYFYDVIKGSADKAQGGIGIVPSIYNKAAEYWVDRENKKEGTIDAIIAQIQLREARPVKTINRKEEKVKNRAKWSLDDI